MAARAKMMRETKVTTMMKMTKMSKTTMMKMMKITMKTNIAPSSIWISSSSG
jgi:hypothetical protein